MKTSFLLLLLMLFASCGKDEFVAKTENQVKKAIGSIVSTSQGCAGMTKIKPPVDILFVFDNSSSTSFINANTKAALTNTIQKVSENFDYHIVVAPLIANGNENFPIVASSPTGLGSVLNQITGADNITFPASVAGTAYDVGGVEKGFKRVVDIIKNNMSNGIFRKKAYTIVVLVSNGDDNDYVSSCPQCAPTSDNYNLYKGELQKFTKKYADSQGGSGSGSSGTSFPGTFQISPTSNLLASPQLHFISVVSHADHSGGWIRGTRYMNMSRELYNYVFNTTYGTNTLVNTADLYSYTSGTSIFDGVNYLIQAVILEHKYDYWPVAPQKNFDPAKLVVKKNGTPLVSGDLLNGYVFEDLLQTKDTRYYPTAGEPYTGYLIKLFGNGQVKYNATTGSADCMTITTTAPPQYFGYVDLLKQPKLETVDLKVNGNSIPQSATNGWSYYGYSPSLNIQVKSPSDDTPEPNPGVYRSGYFLKLNGSAVYTNGDFIQVNFKATNE